MEVNIMSVGLIGTNCYILSKNDEALIIDPGGDADRITRLVDEKNIRPLAILLTHAHYDHIGALEELRREFEVDVHINEAEQHWLSNPSWNGSHKLPGGYITASPAEKLLEEGEMAIGSFHFRILHTPNGNRLFPFPYPPYSWSFTGKHEFHIRGDETNIQWRCFVSTGDRQDGLAWW